MEEVQIHDTLNPKLWEKWQEKRIGGKITYHLKDEVADKLNEIAHAFIEQLEIPSDAVRDILLLGSSASYNYTSYSDIDLHISVDYDKVHKDCPVVQGYLFAQKSLFNKEHDITIYGIPVEVYAESTKDKTQSNGIYSLRNKRWIEEPKKIKPDEENDTAVKAKYNELQKAILDTNAQDEAQSILDKVYKMRKAGLERGGEFSVENIVFKKLRNNNLLQKLKDQIKISFDRELSLKESLSSYMAMNVILGYITE